LERGGDVRIGYVLRNSGQDAVRVVRVLPSRLEELGFDSLWVTDHVIGVDAFAPKYELEWSEPLTDLAFIAATTVRIRVGIGVLVIPYRNPVYTAKVLSTIDNLSDGRLVVGVGAGWSRKEYAALGCHEKYEHRGRVMDEALEVIFRCWHGGRFSWTGEFFEFRDITFSPTPVQKPRPPVWVGGQTPPALRRAARVADSWHPTNVSPAELSRLGGQLDEMAGRQVARTLRLGIGLDQVEGIKDLVAAYEAAGCQEIAIGSLDWGFDRQLALAEQLSIRLQLT
jgi:probable F420-dependent oxidoreductase